MNYCLIGLSNGRDQHLRILVNTKKGSLLLNCHVFWTTNFTLFTLCGGGWLSKMTGVIPFFFNKFQFFFRRNFFDAKA